MKLTDDELTRLAASAVMGWEVYTIGREIALDATVTRFIQKSESHWAAYRPDGLDDWTPPLTDWRAAGEIVDKMRADGWALLLVQRNKTYCAVFVPSGLNAGYQVENDGDESPPRAITIAALFTLGAVTQEQV